MIDYSIEKLTQLLIQQDLKDKKMEKKELISKSQVYKDLIKLLKEVRNFG